MRVSRIVVAGLGGYLVGSFPTRELAARMAAGRPDAAASDVDPHAASTRVAEVAAVVAKSALASVGGYGLAGPPGLIIATAASLAGDRFPVRRLLKARSQPLGPTPGETAA